MGYDYYVRWQKWELFIKWAPLWAQIGPFLNGLLYSIFFRSIYLFHDETVLNSQQ